VKWGNAHGGKGLLKEPLGQGHNHCMKMRVKAGNRTVLITYPKNGREVILKSRMRENIKVGSVGAHSSFREEVAMNSTRRNKRKICISRIT